MVAIAARIRIPILPVDGANIYAAPAVRTVTEGGMEI